MTEEIQTQQSQQQQQQQQQQTQPSPQQQSDQNQPQQQKPRLGPNDYRNSEFVTKLMAANPPYMFAPAIGPHNFFFSEMLRSLVANKRNESLRNAEQLHHQQQQQQQREQQREQVQAQVQSLPLHTRRPRKRSWSQHRLYPESLKEQVEDKPSGTTPEKPLELTNKLSAFTRNITSKYDNVDTTGDNFKQSQEAAKTSPEKTQINNNLIPEPPTGSMPPSDLILPPPPPVWYPPLYPPYGIDPLHFFIDLRVSGHIYDRKKDAENNNSTVVKSEHSKLIGTNGDRQGSAFSVPKPRDLLKPSTTAINLSSPPLPSDEKPPKTPQSPLFLGDFTAAAAAADNKYDIIKNTNYVMQNLPRIYGELNHTPMSSSPPPTGKDDDDNRSDDQDCKSVGSNEDYGGCGDEGKFREMDLNVISDEEESIAVDEN